MSRSLNILLAEDEAIILCGFKAFLQKMGHNVIAEAYDGESAVRLARSCEPDLLIMDIKLPKLDGIHALEKINAGEIRFPCIFVTAYAAPEFIEQARDLGAFGYLIKPVSADSLEAAIQIAIQRFVDYTSKCGELQKSREDLANRKTIERAKGFLMDEFDMKERQAMEYMQKKARNTNRKMHEVALDVLRATAIYRKP